MTRGSSPPRPRRRQERRTVTDRASGKPALLFGLDLIDCVSESDCRFRGSYYEGNLSAQGNVYRARLVNGWRAAMESRGPAS